MQLDHLLSIGLQMKTVFLQIQLPLGTNRMVQYQQKDQWIGCSDRILSHIFAKVVSKGKNVLAVKKMVKTTNAFSRSSGENRKQCDQAAYKSLCFLKVEPQLHFWKGDWFLRDRKRKITKLDSSRKRALKQDGYVIHQKKYITKFGKIKRVSFVIVKHT